MSEYEENTLGSEELLNCLAVIITNELIRCTLNFKIRNVDFSKLNSISVSIDYINQHFSEKITVKLLSSLVNMSESNFNKIFKKQIGLSPIEYLINTRIKNPRSSFEKLIIQLRIYL